MSASRSHGIAARHGQPAGVVTRTLAGAIEYLLCGALVMLGYLGFMALRFVTNPVGFSWPQISWLGLITCALAFLVVYLSLAWSATGRPLGGTIMGTHVVTRQGRRLGLALSFIRAVTVVALPIGLFWSAIDPRRRSVQDIILRTQVVYEYDVPTPHPIRPEQ